MEGCFGINNLCYKHRSAGDDAYKWSCELKRSLYSLEGLAFMKNLVILAARLCHLPVTRRKLTLHRTTFCLCEQGHILDAATTAVQSDNKAGTCH